MTYVSRELFNRNLSNVEACSIYLLFTDNEIIILQVQHAKNRNRAP